MEDKYGKKIDKLKTKKLVCLNGHRIYWESSAILAIESDYT